MKENACHLLLEDLSESHRSLEFGLPPSRDEAFAIAETLATIHGYWWDAPQLGKDVGEQATEDELVAYTNKLADAFPRLAAIPFNEA